MTYKIKNFIISKNFTPYSFVSLSFTHCFEQTASKQFSNIFASSLFFFTKYLASYFKIHDLIISKPSLLIFPSRVNGHRRVPLRVHIHLASDDVRLSADYGGGRGAVQDPSNNKACPLLHRPMPVAPKALTTMLSVRLHLSNIEFATPVHSSWSSPSLPIPYVINFLPKGLLVGLSCRETRSVLRFGNSSGCNLEGWS